MRVIKVLNWVGVWLMTNCVAVEFIMGDWPLLCASVVVLVWNLYCAVYL